MALFGSIATLRTQTPPRPEFATAFEYANDLLRPDSAARRRMGAMPSGGSEKLELGRGVFAIEQVYPTKARAEGFFESHQRYIDVQVIVEGEELMEVIDIGRISPREPWDAARDLAIYQDAPHASKLHLLPNEAAIFFPSDVHMPSLRVTSARALVRKSVIKVPVA